MSRALKIKALIIFTVMLASIYGIIGVPRSRSELLSNLRNNIHLGADLRGGGQLTMQVQLQDAFNAEAHTIASSLRDAIDKAGINAAISTVEATNVANATQAAVRITGLSPGTLPKLRSISSTNNSLHGLPPRAPPKSNSP